MKNPACSIIFTALMATLICAHGIPANPTLVPGTWANITPSGQGTCTDLQFDASHPSTLYGVFPSTGIFKSTDGGSNWKQIGNLPSNLSLGRVRVDGKNPANLYYIGSVGGNSLGFWVSHDTGNTWAIPAAFSAGAQTTWNYDVYNMAVDPLNFDHVIMDFHSSWTGYGSDAGIVESKDGGITFIAHPPISGMSLGQGIAFLHDPVHGLGDENTWLVGGGYNSALYRTTNAGATWTNVQAIQENHGGFDAHYSPATGYVYMGGWNGVWRSTNNGVNWTNVMNSGGNTYYSVIGDGNRLYSGQSFVGTVYNKPFIASNEGGGANEGTSWSNYGMALPEGPFRMAFDSTNRIIYAATWSGGARALKTVAAATSVSAAKAPASTLKQCYRNVGFARNRLVVVTRVDGCGRSEVYNVNGRALVPSSLAR